MRIEEISEFGFYIFDCEGHPIKIECDDFEEVLKAIKISKRMMKEEQGG